VSPCCIDVLNSLTEACAKVFVQSKNYEKAANLLERSLANRCQSGDFCNYFRMQLAEIYVALGNFLDATLLIYEAYSNISGSEYDGVQLTSAE
ncbi:MAG TPA: hypothetical protein PKZ32_15585, partial [Candidatus Melainabacteria bacterium]|nr:hypothetical protein [Candidatus Melainabacteria bacterium]